MTTYYTEKEILEMWNHLEFHDARGLSILRQLTLETPEYLKAILRKHGCGPAINPEGLIELTKQHKIDITHMYKVDHATDLEIARALKIYFSAVQEFRDQYDWPPYILTPTNQRLRIDKAIAKYSTLSNRQIAVKLKVPQTWINKWNKNKKEER